MYNNTKILLVLLTLLPDFTVSIHLSSTQNGEGACFGDVLIFRCTVTGFGTLVWYLDTVRVRLFTVQDEPGSESGPGSLPDVANITLVNVDKDPTHPQLGNLTSDLTVVVSNNTIEKYVNCSNGRISKEILIKKQLVPLPIVIKENITGGIGEYSFRLQLQAQNRLYSLSLYNNDTLVMNFTAEGLDISIPGLKYSTRYSLVITNVNCFDKENTTTLEILRAGCRAPPSPVNGSIEEYRSTEEGAEIQFHCHDGYTPNETISSQCLNSSWSPYPMDLVCVLPDPDTPDPDYVTSDPDSNHGSTSVKKGGELVVVGVSSAISLLFLFIVGVAVVFCCCRRKIGVRRKRRTVDNEYTEMLATSPPPSGTTGGRTTTSFAYHYEDPVSPSDSLGRYTIAQSTTRATNDCPPAPGLQASPLQSTHLNEEPVSPSRPESPEGTPPPVPPYRGSSPELHSSLSTLPLVKVNSPESIACGPTGASYCGSQPVPPEDPAPPNLPPRPPAKPPAKKPSQRLEYADVVPQQSSRGNPVLPPPPSGRENTVYSEVRTDLKVDVATTVNKYDRCVTLDNIMCQIRPLAHKWSDFANFLELQDPGMPDVHNHSDEEALKVVVTRWMIRTGNTPTWGKVSGLVRHSGFPELADAINRVYVTGQLPIPIDMNVDYTHQAVPLPHLMMMGGDTSHSGDEEDTPPPPPPRDGTGPSSLSAMFYD